jgi:hypothetical protein
LQLLVLHSQWKVRQESLVAVVDLQDDQVMSQAARESHQAARSTVRGEEESCWVVDMIVVADRPRWVG